MSNAFDRIFLSIRGTITVLATAALAQEYPSEIQKRYITHMATDIALIDKYSNHIMLIVTLDLKTTA